jgi:cell division septation protein DedD
VVAPYTGDRTLESAQQVVPDAYVRNYPDGARVQLGSFSDPEKARAVVEQLQRQGIDAQLQQP